MLCLWVICGASQGDWVRLHFHKFRRASAAIGHPAAEAERKRMTSNPEPDEQASVTFSGLLEQGWLAALIAAQLSATDALRFACAGRLCHAVRLTQPDGPLERQHQWRNDASRYSAHEWQPLAVQRWASIHSVILKCRWHDQGWGNRKGMLSVVAAGGKAPNDSQRWGADVVCGKEPAPHQEEPLTLHFRPMQLAGGALSVEPDATYTICARAGGGGGHSLTVKELDVRVVRFV